LANAEGARRWLEAGLGGRAAAGAHLVAVSANPQKAQAFGVAADAVFPFGAWVGGRYSVWSAVGLGLRIALARGAFERFLAGGAALDAHVRSTPLGKNAAVLKAIVEVWNRSVLRRPARAVVPYARRLSMLPQYLQQLEMESNGKGVRADGTPTTRPTAAIVFGTEGTNAQHAYFQQLHQGPDIVPIDFIGALDDPVGEPDMTRGLLANMIAQGEAFLRGRTAEEAEAELLAAGRPAEEAKALAPHRTFTGGRPSTTILLDRLDAERLGALIALHEHAVFIQSVMLGINAFDQWGVELGKVLATQIERELDGAPATPHDPSTAQLIARVRDAFAKTLAA
jgi:glucose-6-phosphate isomerase